MIKTGMGIKAWAAGLAMAAVVAGTAVPASAGDYSGDFMVRVQGTVVNPDVDSNPPGLDVSTEVIPTLTLSYFFTKNVAVELFCCFAKHQAELAGAGDVADFWIFPPALTLQYHFDGMGAFKPYVGAGVQYIAPFSEDGTGALAGVDVDIDDALGFTLQAGFDVEVGLGWYLNADVKKTWIDHTVSVGGVEAFDIDLDPWIFSVGLGYRFNLSDIFGSRTAEAVPMK
jgi:outer membrane protein